MRLKIVSDGTANGTRITDEDGRMLEGVQSVAWECHVKRHFGLAVITVNGVELDADTLLMGGDEDESVQSFRDAVLSFRDDDTSTGADADVSPPGFEGER